MDLKQLWFTKGKSIRGLAAHTGTEELAPQRGLRAALGWRWEGGGPALNGRPSAGLYSSPQPCHMS